MSDEEDDYYYDYDDDDYIYLEDDVIDQVDDLAEHTMHSPVLVNFDPAFDVAEDYSDWYYYSDDFYDGESNGNGHEALPQSETPHRKAHKRRRRTSSPARKKRKLDSKTRGIVSPSRSSSESEYISRESSTPIVLWKKGEILPQTPVLIDGEGEKVALLRDWRERLNWPTERKPINQPPKRVAPAKLRTLRNAPIPQPSRGTSLKSRKQQSSHAAPSKRLIETEEVESEGEHPDNQSKKGPLASTMTSTSRKIKPLPKRKTADVSHLQGGSEHPTISSEVKETDVSRTGSRKSKRLKRG